ncbi:unnamed protein product [Camellia sinensis]
MNTVLEKCDKSNVVELFQNIGNCVLTYCATPNFHPGFRQLLFALYTGYVNDGRPFWQYIVSSSTGCSDSQYFEELYNYYTTEKLAWFAALIVFKAIRSEGMKLAVVEAEKPNPTIFLSL